jgi:uncharacterized protein YbjT (DUF2867 family)
MKVLLPGIAGFVGKAVLRHLLANGHEVIGLIRSNKDRDQIGDRASTQLIIGDVTDPSAWAQAIPHVDAVIYLPGLLREFPSKGVTFQSVHADGVKSLLEVAKSKGATRWIQMSALGVGKGYHTGYYDTKLVGEEHVKGCELDWTIFRPSVVFSEDYDPRANFVSELGNVIAKAPVIPVFGDGDYRLQPVALDVLAKAMVDSLTMTETYGKIYEVGGPEKLSYRDILKTIAAAQGMSRKPILRVPFGPVKFAASLFDKFAFFPVTRDQLTMLEQENVVDSDADIAMFSNTFRPRTVRFTDGVQSYFAGKR